MSQLAVQNDKGQPGQLHFGIQPPSSSSTDSIPPQFMDSTFQDSPTIGRTQLLPYTPTSTSNSTPSQGQTSGSGSRYEMAHPILAFL